MWRGPAFADAIDVADVQIEAARLEEFRVSLLEVLVEAELACGRHHDVVVRLKDLANAHPYRERLWAALITALYRSGRQSDALRAFNELRCLLREELGIDPSPPLRALEQAVLEQSPWVDEPQQPTSPPTPSFDPPPTRYARRDGWYLAYQIFGDGEHDLVFLATGLSHVEIAWEHPAHAAFLLGLASLGRVVFVDKRGMGMSDRALPGELGDLAEDVVAVLDAAEMRQPVLVGVSEGAGIAAHVAVAHPERVAGLVLASTTPVGRADEECPWALTDADYEAMLKFERYWGTGKSLRWFAPSVATDPVAMAWYGRMERLSIALSDFVRLFDKFYRTTDWRPILFPDLGPNFGSAPTGRTCPVGRRAVHRRPDSGGPDGRAPRRRPPAVLRRRRLLLRGRPRVPTAGSRVEPAGGPRRRRRSLRSLTRRESALRSRGS